LIDEANSRQRINELLTEFSVYKTAYSSLEEKKLSLEQTLEKLKRETDQERHDMENKLRVSDRHFADIS
jgi:hypothetical protein